MIRIWCAALVRRRPGHLIGVAAGVGVAVALLASLGTFLADARSSMTSRAIGSVGVDWQVQVSKGADPAAVGKLVSGTPHVEAIRTVGFAQVSGFGSSGGTSQTTGAGVVLGIPADYRTAFPAMVRTLTGSGQGVLIMQQTAANLHAGPGSHITVQRPGLPDLPLTVAGVVDLPQADSLFQTVGAPVGAQPSAPPDNVVLLPLTEWRRATAPLAAARPDLVSSQIHARLDHALPTDPAAAYTSATGAARNLEARSSGTAVVGDNLAAVLDSARSDAAYAQILFLFLGLPGTILAGCLTATVAASGASRRRAEQTLLRTRGASRRQLVRLAAVEAGLVALLGCAAGLAAALIIGSTSFGSASFGSTAGITLGWSGLAVATGLLITAAVLLVPALRDARAVTVAAGRAEVETIRRYPWWARYGLDVAALIGAGLVFRTTSGNGYQLVLAPEGVPTISVSYWAFAGPALLWLGAALLVWRLVDLLLGRGRRVWAVGLRPLAGRFAPSLSSSMSRQRRPLVRAATLLALALAFAISTATFNVTYRAQAEADAQLTNGADVTVTESPGVTVTPGFVDRLAAVPGVHAVEPVQHRFAYVGADLQDLFGIDPQSIRNVTAVRDSYFLGGTAGALLHTLQTTPDSILVSSETVKDYQLHVGDLLNLRLVDATTHRPVTVPFHYVGIVAEFPTAPKDSFLVANASYVARRTASAAVGSFLVDTGGSDTAAVAARIRALVGSGAAVTDISTVRGAVGSSLTSVDLSGLTRVELGFALVLACAAGGLVVALGLAQRRRSLAIMSALGAHRRHLRAAVAGETLVVGVAGAIGGIVLGYVVTHMLVTVLTGVFDPPPDVIAVPWLYLTSVGSLAATSLVAATAGTLWVARRGLLPVIRRF